MISKSSLNLSSCPFFKLKRAISLGSFDVFCKNICALVGIELAEFFISGLQLGFYLERAGRDYIIFERDALAGILGIF